MPNCDSAAASSIPSSENWLAQYQLQLPSSITTRDASTVRSLHYHYNEREEQFERESSGQESFPVFEPTSDEVDSGLFSRFDRLAILPS